MKSQGACGWLQKYFQLIKWWCMWSLGVKVGAVRRRKWEEKGHFHFLMNAAPGSSLMHTRGPHGKQLHMFDLTDFYFLFFTPDALLETMPKGLVSLCRIKLGSFCYFRWKCKPLHCRIHFLWDCSTLCIWYHFID